ncbi:MAG TPA: hypothetical protein VEX13_01080 [Chloroflexia bacterium]|nr:hypothetical protein [Chloroflexia bacterium]
MTLVERLQELQTNHNLEDNEFAARLGISTTLWIFIKQGKRKIGNKTIRGLFQAFPDDAELKAHVLAHLSGTPVQQATNVA